MKDKAENKAPQSKFVFNNQSQIRVDTYKLSTTPMKKNISYTKVPHLENVDHTHFFHTFDSSGIQQTHVNLVGNHTHEMILISPATENEPAKYKCGPPITQKVVIDENTGKAKKSWEKVRFDEHVHEAVTYIKSDMVDLRKANKDAALIIGQEAAKTASIPGIIG